VFLTSFEGNVNQYEFKTMRVSSVVAYWARINVVMGLNPTKVFFFLFHAAAMLLFYIIQRITIPKLCIFENLLHYIFVQPC
jgi:hypothetical protein